jgi:hypothetical protein
VEHLNSETEQLFIREKIMELLSKGYPQREIATVMQLSLRKTNAIIQQLKAEAKQNINNYINEELPAAYESTLEGINRVIKIAWENVDEAPNVRDANQAMATLMEAYEVRLHLLSSAESLRQAVSYVDKHKQTTDAVVVEDTAPAEQQTTEDNNNNNEDKTTG